MGVPLGYLLHIRPEFDSRGTSYGILSRLRFRGKAVGYWQGLLTPIGRIAPKVEARCVSQILSGKLISLSQEFQDVLRAS